ncbi:MAG TPA: hypothetical protein VIT88_15015 [Pyrinomonadaceae bacterium]
MGHSQFACCDARSKHNSSLTLQAQTFGSAILCTSPRNLSASRLKATVGCTNPPGVYARPPGIIVFNGLALIRVEAVVVDRKGVGTEVELEVVDVDQRHTVAENVVAITLAIPPGGPSGSLALGITITGC